MLTNLRLTRVRAAAATLAILAALAAAGPALAQSGTSADPGAPAAGPAAALAAGAGIEVAMDRPLDPDRYLLGPGDRLLLVLEGRQMRRFPLTVLPTGLLDWEGGLQMQAAGLSLAEAGRRAAALLAPQMRDVKVGLLLVEPRLIEVHVGGEVRQPGVVRLRASDRVSKAVQAAGGPSARGSRRFVELKAPGSSERVDLYPFLMGGNWTANPYCASDRLLFVPVRSDSVMLVGEVRRPGAYEWREGETLGDFLGYAQGLTDDALPASILLERDEREVQLQLLGARDAALPLRPGDVVVVGSRRPLMNRVFLEGAGERRGEMYLSPGETLADLARRLGDTQGLALPESAILERKGTERSEFLRVNLKEVFRGEGPADMPIQNDDVLYVPIRSREVFVLGEVAEPGPLSYRPDFTAAQYLAEAGGTTSKGSTGKLSVIDPEGNERRVRGTDHLHRGDILVIHKSNFSIFSELLVTTVSLSGIVLAINALAK